jgi:hypothetical protein
MDALADDRMIVDEKNPHHRSRPPAVGILTVMTVPFPPVRRS